MNCFQLISRETGSAVDLNVVDDGLYAHFEHKPDPDFWYRDWYPVVGLGLSMGHDWDALWERLPEYRDIIDYLRERYDFRAWAGRV